MRIMKTKYPVKRPLAGFTLLEVLISVLVLSVGLLGLAGLQATGLKTNHSAYMRSQAVSYGYDILDRMRANRLSALSGTYNIAMGAGAPAGTSIAQTDLREWKNLIAGHLQPAVLLRKRRGCRILPKDRHRGEGEPVAIAGPEVEAGPIGHRCIEACTEEVSSREG